MATQVPFIFRAAPLPSNFVGTPQDFAEAFAARLSAESEIEIAVFVSGSVAPTSNVGPWLKDGTTWYVWDNVTGAYIPQVVAPTSLGYIAAETAPDPLLYTFWIQLDGTGKAISINYYSASAWHDIYEDKFLEYWTITQTQAAIAAGSFRGYPAQGTNAAPQVVPIDTLGHKIMLDVAPINSGSPFGTVLSRYVSPVAGFYQVSVETQFDNSTGVAAQMQICLAIYLNGVDTGLGSCESVPSPPGSRWFPDLSGTLVSMAANDYLEIYCTAQDGTNSGNLTLTTARANIVRVPS